MTIQERIYRFIIDYKQRYDGNSPTVREIMIACGISSTATVHARLQELKRMDKIRIIGPSCARNIIIPGGRWTRPEERLET